MAGAFWDGTRNLLADALASVRPSEAINPGLKQAADGLGLSEHVLSSSSPFLDSLARNPHGWGPSGPSLDPAYDAPVQPGDETWRSGLFPLRTVVAGEGNDRNGRPLENVEFAMPGMLKEMGSAVMAPGKALFEGMTDDEIRQAGSSIAGLAMTGGLAAGPLEANALASGLRRAPETQPMRVYHGTAAVRDFDKFNRPPWMTENPDVASAAAYPSVSPDFEHLRNPGAPRVFPLEINPRNPYIMDYADMLPDKSAAERYGYAYNPGDDPHAVAAANGHDFVIYENTPQDFGVSDRHRQIVPLQPNTVRSATTGETLFSNGSREGAGVGLANALANDTKPGITAYHGSPHDFDKFSLDRIGTGEGAQAYGHGLYFAENEAVARDYRRSLSRGEVAKVDGSGLSRELTNILDAHRGDVEAALKELVDHRNSVSSGKSAFAKARLPNTDALIRDLQAIKGKQVDLPGHMYQVRINADPNDFLDWDKPLSQQSDAVRRSMSQAAYGEVLPEWTGADAYHSVGSQMFSEPNIMSPEISQRVREAGIPGIRYLDQGSRAAGEGSSNYVVFDDSLIEILKKYGWLPPAYAAGFGAFGPGKDD